MIKSFFQNKLIKYVLAGGMATAVDWGSFYLFAQQWGIHYQLSLIGAFTLGSLTNYIVNKIYTFGCKSKKIFKQISVHFTISAISLAMSAGLMYAFVDFTELDKMISRMMITAVMLAVNFFLHKNITFNKQIFE